MSDSFDLCGPLPDGTLLLEASAGTGKTYTVAALATRYLAEGMCTLDQLLMITYTRAATRELRERVRARLRSTARALRGDGPVEDPVTRLLAAGDPADVAVRAERLEQALTSFDAATIATTHSFCEQVVGSLGITADKDPSELFSEDLTELIEEVTTDLYVRDYGTHGAPPPPFGLETAVTIAREVVGDSQAALDVDHDAERASEPAQESEAQARQRFAEEVRAEVLRRRRSRRTTVYEDLITRVAAAIDDPRTGTTVRDLMRERFRVVMVDEFQDTDPAQWDILRRVFHERTTLILIGDPKQAIYAFRGGDIVTYLRARDVADPVATLDRNHRTDEPLVRAVGALFEGTALGHRSIAVDPGDAVHTRRRLEGAGPCLRLRTVESGLMDDLRERIDRDLVRDIVALLNSPATLPATDGDPGLRRAVCARDIAVIVGTNKDADRLRGCLRAAGVNAVVTGTSDVFQAPAGKEWTTLLHALDKPQRSALVRAAMVSSFFPYSGTDLARDDGTLTDRTAQVLQEWASAFETGGIAAVLGRAEPEMTARLLARPDGERLLTDLRHIGERLHSVGGGVGIAGLIEWLAVHRPDTEEVTEAARRLDSDLDAVQILTMHSAKGLEFPIVYLPYAWSRYQGRRRQVLRFHDAQLRRVLDVRGAHTPNGAAHRRAHDQEDDGERLRQLYVAMTRASCQLVVWWAYGKRNTPASPLQRLCGARLEGHREPAASYGITDVDTIAQALGVEAEPIDTADPAPLARRAESVTELRPATFDRTVDTSWHRTSYTRLTAAAHDAHLSPSDTPDGESDESPAAPSVTGAGDDGESSPWATLPVGAVVGVIVHRVYETIDPTAADLAAEVERRCQEALRERPFEGLDPEMLAHAVLPTLAGPLGLGSTTLSDIAPSDRLTELEFEMPLAGGDQSQAVVFLRQVTDLLEQALPADDPLAAYPQAMRADGLDRRLNGFLTGSIDAVLRVPGPSGSRFVVVDYKTNWIGGDLGSHRLPVAAYDQSALTEAMIVAHYPLQALLYQVAVHRFLRWRLPGYDPDRHLGGIRYLFVRGMTPTAPPPAGVFAWQPPPGLVPALSDLLAGRS